MSLTVVRIIPTDAVAREMLASCSAFWSFVSMSIPPILSTEYNASIMPFRPYPRSTSRKKAKTENLKLFNCQLRIESQKKSMHALVTYSYINVHRVHCGVFETRITIITICLIITTIGPPRYQIYLVSCAKWLNNECLNVFDKIIICQMTNFCILGHKCLSTSTGVYQFYKCLSKSPRPVLKYCWSEWTKTYNKNSYKEVSASLSLYLIFHYMHW